MRIRELQEKYDKLKTDYDNLKQDYETETDQKYWKEYTLHMGDVVVNPRLNSSIEIRFIYESLESASIRLSKYGEEDNSKSILLHKAAPYDLTGEGDFFVIAKEFGDDSFTMIITEK